MSKTLTITVDGVESKFGLDSLDRSDLYGKRRRIAVGPDGQPCVRVSLTLDGSTILRSGMTGQAYFLPDGRALKQSQLEAYDTDGRKLEKNPSSLSSTVKAEGPVPATDLLDIKVSSVYMLDPEEVDAALKAALADGAIYSFDFSYRDSYTPERAFLFSNAQGVFMVSGDPVKREWVSLPATAALPVADDEDDDDLDFEML